VKLFNEQLELCEGKVNVALLEPPVKLQYNPQLSGVKSEQPYLEVHIFSKENEPPVEVNSLVAH
jgi:hypothetical protein